MTSIPITRVQDMYQRPLQDHCTLIDGIKHPPELVLHQPDGSRLRARIGDTVTIHDDHTITVTRTPKEQTDE